MCPILLKELEKVANSSEEFDVEFRQMLLENLKLLSCSYINIAEIVLKVFSSTNIRLYLTLYFQIILWMKDLLNK